MGDSKRPLYALLACGILNVALNFLFVCGFGMKSNGQDVFAVGFTTVISQAVEAVLIVLFLHPEEQDLRLADVQRSQAFIPKRQKRF
jgi:Na+-driven multidrug efflux pump